MRNFEMNLKKKTKKKKSFNKKPYRKEEKEKRRGPRLPSILRRELHLQNSHGDESEEDEEANGGSGRPPLSSDMYEYEENQAPEESLKNRRFDNVDRLEYELPSDFEDEEIDEGAANGEDHGDHNKRPKGKKQLAFGGKRKQIKGHQSDDGDSYEEVNSESDGLDTYKRGMQDGSDELDGNEDSSDHADEEDDVDREQEDSDIEAEGDDEDDERHQRMINAVRKTHAKEPRDKRPKRFELLSEAYPESEFNINPTTDGNNMQQITVEDLMTPLQSTTGFGSLRKRMQQLEEKGVVLNAPLPSAVQDRLSRKAGYEKANEEISKWQDIVKKNREAPSLVFTQRPDLTAVSTSELVSKFEPVTDLEKEVASLLQENGLAEERSEAGASLGFNKLTMSEVKERQERLAKMRTMLSYHETKAKRMKKIKSKAFHRLLNKDRKGKVEVEDELDPEALKEAAMKAEFKRAQERMTLKHKNTSKWAKRIIQRGLKAKEDGSREALAEQLRAHTALTRKIHAVDHSSSSDDSSEETGADSGLEDDAKGGLSLSMKPKAKLLAKAKVETLKVLEGDAEAEIPTSGLFALPFMARAIERKRKQAQNEAMAVLEQLEQLEYNMDGNGDLVFEGRDAVAVASTGRLGFGDMTKSIGNGKEQEPDMLVEKGSSSDENEPEAHHTIQRAKEIPVVPKKRKVASGDSIDKICNGVASQTQKLRVTEEAWTNGGVGRTRVSQSQNLHVAQAVELPLEDCGAGHSTAGAVNPWLYGELNRNEKNVTVEGSDGHRTGPSLEERSGSLVTSASIELVNIAGAKRKVKKDVVVVQNGRSLDPAPTEEAKKTAPLSSSDSEDNENEEKEEPGFQLMTENVSQAELIQRAFAGDDVEADFEQMKSEALNEEVPMGEAALSLPGWGQWTDVQKRKGPPLWMVKQQEELKRRRDQALAKRKDSKLAHVIISERVDKKAEKFLAPALPFPFKSRDVFEKSMRMPLGREYNTDQAFRDMIRPAVVKDAGVIIDPIKYKMSDGKASESNRAPKEKTKGEKRANGRRFKRKS